MVVDDPENIRLAVVHAQSVALQSENVIVFGNDDGHANIDIREQTQILVIDQAGRLANIPIAT